MDDPQAAAYLRWIILLPLLGAAANGLVGAWLQRRFGRALTATVASVPIAASLVLTLTAFAHLARRAAGERALVDPGWTWIEVGGLHVDVSLWFDPLSALMATLVTGIGTLVHVCSFGYLRDEPALWRYYALLNLFIGMMLLLVLADNLPLLFVGWQGVGLCSFALIGFRYGKHRDVDAARKAFVIDRIGDVGFLLAMFLLFWATSRGGAPTLSLNAIDGQAAILVHVSFLGVDAATVITLLVLAAVMAKSSQIPLHVWLPSAMAAPTPVSALLHAATMGAAGIYLIARLDALFAMAPITASVMMWIGAATAFLAATVACARTDIKDVLAYSTISQFGLMLLALGVGAPGAAVFHMTVHALFGACLFLGVGSLLVGLGGERDLRRMGGLQRWLPRTHVAFVVGTLALAALPPLSGFFSKSEILWRVLASDHGGAVLWVVGLLTAGVTSFYAFRLLILAFYGDNRSEPHVREKLHEAGPVMMGPLLLLACLVAIVGVAGVPASLGGGHWMAAWLASGKVSVAAVSLPQSFAGERLSMLVLAAVSLGGCFLAHSAYVSRRLSTDWLTAFAGDAITRWVSNGYYVDDLWRRLAGGSARRIGSSATTFEARVIDGSADVAVGLGRAVGRFGDGFERTVVAGSLYGLAALVQTMGGIVQRLQTGRVQFYLGVAASLVVAALLLRMV